MMENSTISVDSTVKDYRIENGRTYHAYKDGSRNVGRVLDLGTGTGIWAIEFGDEHPESEASNVTGVDLSPCENPNLNPGGYLELQESDMAPMSDDGTLTRAHALHRLWTLINEATTRLGRPFIKVPTLKDILTEVGDDERGNLKDGIEAMAMAPPTRGGDMSREGVTVFLTYVRKDVKNRGIHAYFPFYSVVGRKPLSCV
ncbi:methyltransferase domain-containing protein [Colletotrichum plurivorum]|uniref:Methyltransferase domain-containing protein n=1 Tax=Colletotrichum plurivorum TaxID=2175906 RepID=A0A8H6U6D9_9PEZI|nr:methyltransferase domain-containing protein [Colletotrichum plurivorum]